MRALAGGKTRLVDDLVIDRRNGIRTWVRAFANPVFDAHGVISHVVVAFTDITAEVQAVAERAAMEKHLAVAIHHAPVLLFMLDRNGVLTARDGALLAKLDQGRSGMLGQSLFETYKNHPTVPGFVRRALDGETVTYSVEVRDLILDVWLGPLREGRCADGSDRGVHGRHRGAATADTAHSRRSHTRDGHRRCQRRARDQQPAHLCSDQPRGHEARAREFVDRAQQSTRPIDARQSRPPRCVVWNGSGSTSVPRWRAPNEFGRSHESSAHLPGGTTSGS